MITKLNENLSSITSIGVGGKCKAILFPENEEEFVNLLKSLNGKEKFKIVGNGTNLLFSDNFHDIYVICTKKIAKKMSKRRNCVTFSSSTTLFDAYQFCLKNHLSGFEKLATIPGNIGGSLTSGASCFKKSIYDDLEKIQVFYDDKIFWIDKNKMDYGYHFSSFLKNDMTKPFVILNAKFCLKEENPCKIQNEYFSCAIKRKTNQPIGRSFGCTFKNQNNQSTGMLIENCGLKGTKKGDAIISDKHGNFILNTNRANFEDIKYLIDLIQTTIKEKYNITLEKDVEIVE